MLYALLALFLVAPSTAAFAPGLKLRAQFSNARQESQSIARRLGNVAADLLLSGPAPPTAASQRAVAHALHSAPSAQKARARQHPTPQRSNLTPVQKASVDQWFQQYQRTRDIGVGYYNNVAAAGDARVVARAPAPIHVTHPGNVAPPAPQQASYDVAPAPPTYHEPEPVQQPAYHHAPPPAPQPAYRPAPAAATRQPVRHQPVRQDMQMQQRRARGTESLLKQGLAGAALRAKQQKELDAFRKSFNKNRFPTSGI